MPASLAAQDEAAPGAVRLEARTATSGQSATYSFVEETSLDMNLLRLNLLGDVFERTTNDYSVIQRASRVFTDSVLDEDSGRSLRRHYSGFEAGFEMTNNRKGTPKAFGNAAGRSPLVGSTLEIRSGADGGESSAAFADGSEPTELDGFPLQPLPGLDRVAGEVGCAGLLPASADATSIGTKWSIDASAMREVLAPGGDPPAYFGPIQNQQDPDFLALYGSHSISRQIDGLDGKASGTLLGTTDQDGVTVATIELEYDVVLQRNPEAWMHVQCAPFEMAKVGQTATNARHALGLKGRGTLLWDVTNGRMMSVELDAESSSDLAFDYKFHHRGMDFSGDDHLKFSGRSTVTLTASYDD